MKWGTEEGDEVMPLLKEDKEASEVGRFRPRIPFPSFRLFSATSLMDFSYTFHSLIVLSTVNQKGFKG